MSKRNRRFLVLVCVLLAAVLVLSFGNAFGRYLEALTGDQPFQVKPANALKITQQWKQVDDAYVLTFTAGEHAGNCRVYLAVSQGVTAADLLEISLAEPISMETGGVAPLPVILSATAQPITEGSAIYALFGSGTAFLFVDAETGKEKAFDLSRGAYTVTVRGLDSAAELTSLLRLFVEHVRE